MSNDDNNKLGYIALYKNKRLELYADSSYQAQQLAAKHFKAKKAYDVTIMLCERSGKQVYTMPL